MANAAQKRAGTNADLAATALLYEHSRWRTCPIPALSNWNSYLIPPRSLNPIAVNPF